MKNKQPGCAKIHLSARLTRKLLFFAFILTKRQNIKNIMMLSFMGSPPQFQSFNSMSSVMFSDCTIAIGCFNSDHDYDHYEWEGLQWQPITALLWLLVWLLLPIPKSAKGYFRCLPQSGSCRVPVPIWLFAEHWESSTQTAGKPFQRTSFGNSQVCSWIRSTWWLSSLGPHDIIFSKKTNKRKKSVSCPDPTRLSVCRKPLLMF